MPLRHPGIDRSDEAEMRCSGQYPGGLSSPGAGGRILAWPREIQGTFPRGNLGLTSLHLFVVL